MKSIESHLNIYYALPATYKRHEPHLHQSSTSLIVTDVQRSEGVCAVEGMLRDTVDFVDVKNRVAILTFSSQIFPFYLFFYLPGLENLRLATQGSLFLAFLKLLFSFQKFLFQSVFGCVVMTI